MKIKDTLLESDFPFDVNDEHFHRHELTEILTSGGQGVVCKTNDPELLVKLPLADAATRKMLTDPNEIERHKRKYLGLSLLPIPEDIPLALPAASLSDTAGYIMPLVGGMIEFGEQFFLKKAQAKVMYKTREIPSWLSKLFDREDEINKGKGNYFSLNIIHYLKSGGLRRRLSALAKCASILSRLHAHGFVYVDLSPGNVFISDTLENSQVWMIDADNLRYEGTRGTNYFTPGYGAPEVVQGEGHASQLSDSYAFAVMVFILLSMTNPFDGIALEQNDDDDVWEDEWDSSLKKTDSKLSAEKRKELGMLPFIDDMNDKSNEAPDRGLPRQLVLNKQLKACCQQTLGEGRTDPRKRTHMYLWATALAQAEDVTIACKGCGMTYYAHQTECPYCQDTLPSFVKMTAYSDQSKQTVVWEWAKEVSEDKVLMVPQRLGLPFSLKDNANTFIEIQKRKQQFVIKCLDESLPVHWATSSENDGEFRRLAGDLVFTSEIGNDGLYLYIESANPRLIHLKLYGERA
ncbi:TPA: hypothetical protein ACPV0E_001185 [Vibrio parahaemolyticus]